MDLHVSMPCIGSTPRGASSERNVKTGSVNLKQLNVSALYELSRAAFQPLAGNQYEASFSLANKP